MTPDEEEARRHHEKDRPRTKMGPWEDLPKRDRELAVQLERSFREAREAYAKPVAP